jgi:hypothetical protein
MRGPEIRHSSVRVVFKMVFQARTPFSIGRSTCGFSKDMAEECFVTGIF